MFTVFSSLFSFFSSNPLGRYVTSKLKYLAIFLGVVAVAAAGYAYYLHAQAKTKDTIATLTVQNTKLVENVGALAGRVELLADSAEKAASSAEIGNAYDLKAIAAERASVKATNASVIRLRDLHAQVKPIPIVISPNGVQTTVPDPNAEVHATVIAELWEGYCDEINPDNAECGN